MLQTRNKGTKNANKLQTCKQLVELGSTNPQFIFNIHFVGAAPRSTISDGSSCSCAGFIIFFLHVF